MEEIELLYDRLIKKFGQNNFDIYMEHNNRVGHRVILEDNIGEQIRFQWNPPNYKVTFSKHYNRDDYGETFDTVKDVVNYLSDQPFDV